MASPVDDISAALQQLTTLRNGGHIEEEFFREQQQRLQQQLRDAFTALLPASNLPAAAGPSAAAPDAGPSSPTAAATPPAFGLAVAAPESPVSPDHPLKLRRIGSLKNECSSFSNTSSDSDDTGTFEKRLPVGKAAKANKHVFIPLESTVARIQDILKGSELATFIRAPVASGKTTLAWYLIETYPNEFVWLENPGPSADEDKWRSNIIKASGTVQCKGGDVSEALDQLELEGKTLVLDEAHILFSFPNVLHDLIKSRETREGPRLLMFSAASARKANPAGAGDLMTPPEVSQKYIWYPPVPAADILVDELAKAGIRLSADGVEFFMKICCGHRGIFMRAMQWVQTRQESSTDDWCINKCVTEVRASFQSPGWSNGLRQYLTRSRAVRVEGKFETVAQIPEVFVEIIFGGSKTRLSLNEKERELTVHGFVSPERKENSITEFIPYDWNDQDTQYGTSNALLAEYYGYILSKRGYKRSLLEKIPKTSCDLLARVLPYLDFCSVVDTPIQADSGLASPLSPENLPYEEHYTLAIGKVLSNLEYNVSSPQNPVQGKVDLVVSIQDTGGCFITVAMEMVMARRSLTVHNEHIRRFQKFPAYKNAIFRVLVTIGSETSLVKERVGQIEDIVGVEVVGLVVSHAHDSYDMYIRNEQKVLGPFMFRCDRVAKTFARTDAGTITIRPAQELFRARSEISHRAAYE